MRSAHKRWDWGMGFYPASEVNPTNNGCVKIELYDGHEGGARGDILILTEQEARDMANYILKTFPDRGKSEGR